MLVLFVLSNKDVVIKDFIMSSKKKVLSADRKKQILRVFEQQNLSILLLQMLVDVHSKIDLKIDFDIYTSGTHETVVCARTDVGQLLFDIWQETFSDNHRLRVYNGETLVSFESWYPEVFFGDNEYNYAEALFDLIWPGSKKQWTAKALEKLAKKQPKPNLDSAKFWDKRAMAVFPYLKQILADNQK